MTAPDHPITEPLLLERLAMTDDEFIVAVTRAVAQVGRRRYERALYEKAIGYPWARPEGSYFLRGEVVEPLGEFDTAGRYPLLAFGSNGAPGTLATKLAHHPPHERDVPVVAGWLEGHDTGAAAHPTVYGSMAATLFSSPGTAVRAAVLWVTPMQFTQLAWTEVSYRLRRLDGTRFIDDEGAVHHDAPFAFDSRWGVFAPAGAPVAQAAIPARGRTAAALTQEELLAAAAAIALGPDAGAEDLVEAIFTDYAAFVDGPGRRLRPTGRPAAPRST